MFVTDGAGRVVEVNRTATEALGATESDLLGEQLQSVLGAAVADLELVDTVELSTVGGNRQFDPEVSTLTDQRGVDVGDVVTLHDVTDRTIREQRIEVLNRVLRHNLRNKLSIVRGTASYVAEGELPPDDVAEGLDDAASELLTLGEKAREIERVIRNRERPTTRVDLAALVERVADDVREAHPDVTVETAVPRGITFRTDRRLLSYAVENIVENAAEHNDAADPRATVTAEEIEDGEVLRLTVTDNGPGIPNHERAVIEGGEESPLEHGSGLGLWATSWCVTRLGGDLAFEDPDGGGSSVRITVPVTRPGPTPDVGDPAASGVATGTDD